MVEYAVEHHLQPAPVRFVEQRVEGRIAAQQWVDLIIVVGVIAVVRGRLEDWREVDRGRAQVLDVVQALDYAEQVAALVPLGRRRAVPRLEVVRLDQPVALREAVREDLVEHRVLHPIWSVDIGQPFSHLYYSCARHFISISEPALLVILTYDQ